MLKWLLGGIVGIVVLMAVIGMNMSPEKQRAYEAQRQGEAMCDKMMSDAALGSERRTTRELATT